MDAMGRRIWILGIWMVCVASIGWGQDAPKTDPGIILNEDDSHFYGSRTAEEMTNEGLNAFVDQYAGTKVTRLFLCPNAMKASFKSTVFDAIWEIKGTQKQPEEGFARKWCDNAKTLYDSGLDPYAVWIVRCREKGISPWLTMRMNDVHNVDDVNSYIHDSFWRDHPEYWRVPGSTGAWVDRAMDYGIPEVRDHHMKFVRELLERYDPDGLELDWMRFGYHFQPGKEAEGSEILTQFMREARALTQEWAAKRGHPILLSARVPTHPDAAKGLAMDGVRWAQEGLLDMLVPTPFWATSDFDIPIELWRERLGEAGKKIVLAAGQEILLQAYPGAKQITNDITSVRGFAAAHLYRGADQIYLFNYMDAEPMQGEPGTYRTLLEKGLSLEEVTQQPRRHVVTYRDTVPSGVSNNAMLPVNGLAGGAFQIYIGPAPTTGRAFFVMGLTEKPGMDAAEFEVTANETPCNLATDVNSTVTLPSAARTLFYEIPLASMKNGYNQVQVKQKPGVDDQQLVWAEIRIQ